MKRWMFAIGLSFILIGILLIIHSGQPEQTSKVTWSPVKDVVNKLQISENFTAGDKIQLIVSPNSEWVNFGLDVPTDDVPYPAKYVYVNITDPQGGVSMYEIAYVTGPGAYGLSIYQIRVLSQGGFSPQSSNDPETNRTIVGQILYTGSYLAEIVGIFPGGGPPPGYLTFLKETTNIDTAYPYRDYLYPALAMLLLGILLSIWSIKPSKPSKRRTLRKMQRMKKRR